ncbi:hypothetical protein GCM10008171_25860 [Methylopila jiangsuensis]|uniref:TIGR02302 family protein n=1 Tax=Methylopila jiangsuensis TaxID=586230 RepID=A0A9W6JHV6_9HYPH|nr:TIGR02302 family protein [Methylopila jiangsuensis]MDR6285277.1 uncharacterized protein (TIGR02302 family) [Methylopila jiangsuensis]GLK77332.1 hypothetical protein GCM10008171_25860 [Methylopila jiangsuensis]
MNDTHPIPPSSRGSLIDRLARRAALALVWEKAWPALASALVVGLVFLSASWLGLWDALPVWARMAGVALFALAALAALAPLVRLRPEGRRAALARVDRDSALAHRPATSYDDRLAEAGEDPLTRALWAAHRERLEAESARLRAAAPRPRLAARDPYALRFLAALVAVVAFVAAGSDRDARLRAAFDWTTPRAEVPPVRVDAWLTPPPYTGRPPIFLTAAKAQGEAAPEVTRAPAGSLLVVRVAGGTAEVTATGGLEQATPEDAKRPEGLTEHRFRLTGASELRVAGDGDAAPRSWRFAAIPDAPPTIRLSEPPQRNARGGATLRYEVTDDYGVVAAEARFALKPAETPKDGQAEERRPLYEAPKIALTLPRKRAREGKGQTSLDLAEHPFAGAEAVMTLVAKDEAGQEGLSAPETLRLPGRPFVNPLARALVEQRRTLALDANAKPEVARALQALMLYPEEFTPRASVYLGLRTAYRRLDIAQTDDELRAVADHLWEMALRLEDGDLPDAERKLRQAEQELREALENGASEQEIAKLTEELRKALDAFMKELAQRAQQQPGQQAQTPPNGAQAIRPDDLRKMIDRMEQMAKSGSREAAQQALNELREMLDNLRTAQPGQQQQGDPQQSQNQQQMDKLQGMIREQNQLRDKTYQQYRQQERAERNQRGRDGQPRQGQSGDMQALAEQQRQLQKKLDELMQEMSPGGQPDRPNQPQRPGENGGEGQQQQQQGQSGQGQQGEGRQGQGQQGQGQPGQGQGRQAQGEGQGQGQDPLGEAGRSMGDARGALGQGRTGQALDDQSRALDNLRKGAQALAEQMRQQAEQQGQQPGQGQQGAENGQADGRDDPLGRPVRRRESDGTGTKVPGEIEAQRARRVLEELRRRIGESERPREELDYLERLLTP